MSSRLFLLGAATVAATLAGGLAGEGSAGPRCQPTRPDSLGPFYKPGAPLRAKVGTGYLLTGIVRSASTCRPIPRARIEFWLVNRAGRYDDAHRATVQATRRGRYRFQSNKPVAYGSRPPHIHIRVRARGFPVFVTQHYPRARARRARFDLVIPK